MDCFETKQDLYLYMDGELHVWRRVRVRVHLDACSYCQGGHDFELYLREQLRRACTSHPPHGLAERIQRALDD